MVVEFVGIVNDIVGAFVDNREKLGAVRGWERLANVVFAIQQSYVFLHTCDSEARS